MKISHWVTLSPHWWTVSLLSPNGTLCFFFDSYAEHLVWLSADLSGCSPGWKWFVWCKFHLFHTLPTTQNTATSQYQLTHITCVYIHLSQEQPHCLACLPSLAMDSAAALPAGWLCQPLLRMAAGSAGSCLSGTPTFGVFTGAAALWGLGSASRAQLMPTGNESGSTAVTAAYPRSWEPCQWRGSCSLS